MNKFCLWLFCFAVSGCQPGSGEFLTLEPEDDAKSGLAEIQQKIFTPICAQCHVGSQAPLGLRLDSESQAYNNLVNVAAVGNSNYLRVEPFDADNSFIMLKILGDPVAGQRMPLGLTPLTNEQIGLVRQWIDDGAPAASANELGKLVTESVLISETDIQISIRLINVHGPISIYEESIEVYQIYDGMKILLSPGEVQLAIQQNQRLIINLARQSLTAHQLKILIGEETSYPLVDHNGNWLDFNHNNQAGGTYELSVQLD